LNIDNKILCYKPVVSCRRQRWTGTQRDDY